MYQAEWMVESGKTSEDWDNLSISDVKLIMAYLSARRQGIKNMISEVMGDMFGKRK